MGAADCFDSLAGPVVEAMELAEEAGKHAQDRPVSNTVGVPPVAVEEEEEEAGEREKNLRVSHR